MASSLHNLSDYNADAMPDASGMKFGIVVSEWNSKITNALLEGAVQTLMANGVSEADITVHYVPGSFELIFNKWML